MILLVVLLSAYTFVGICYAVFVCSVFCKDKDDEQVVIGNLLLCD